MDDLDELIRQADAEIAERENSVSAADARVTAAQADAAAERAGLQESRIAREWLQRRRESRPVPTSPALRRDVRPEAELQMRFGKPVPEGPAKLQQCMTALDELGGIASNKQISSHLLQRGIEISPDHVRGLLKYESSKGTPLVVTQRGSGVWRSTRLLNGAGGSR